MGNTVTRNEKTSQEKIVARRNLAEQPQAAVATATTIEATAVGDKKSTTTIKTANSTETTTTTTTITTTAAAVTTKAVATIEEAAPAQRQFSIWSLGSLNFSGAARNSFRHRNKSTRKSLSSLQQRRSKTVWHKPLTNVIFSSHFKESSRNDQFHIEQLVAKGAFGVVFKVIDKQQNSASEANHNNDNKQRPQHQQQPSATLVYALKVLKKSKIIEENSVQQIKDEADIQKLCGHHPYVVQQVDLWQNRHNLHILSEYVPNGELFSRINKFSIDLVRLYLAEIALAIDFLHNAGIIYRDAKPENILLTQTFHIKLIDFGLSKWLKLGATTKTMCGTFQYMGTI